MSRYPQLAAAAALALLAGCFNAPGSGNGTSSGTNFGNGNVTAGGQGAHTINGTVRVPDGERTGDLSTVNGSIQIGNNVTLTTARTVNGSISVGSHATADTLSTVNGSISLADAVRVSQTVRSVNGSVSLDSGDDVRGSIANVNGAIHLNAAHVGGGITTANGDITVEGASHVDGGILVQKPASGWFQFAREPRIVIGPGSVVTGTLRFDRKVDLYVSTNAKIGPVVGATPQRYPGEGPIG
jgi:DUF4097 and DUF4098 domain-containing protein YvlB